MNYLPYKFPNKHKGKAREISGEVGLSASQVARAAMQIGLERLEGLSNEELKERIVLKEARSRC